MKVMIIRHAEKPGDAEGRVPPFGVDEDGRPDPHGLSPLGWQRAGALVGWFLRAEGGIATPAALFAPNRHGNTHRSQQTLAPLARRLGLAVQADFHVGEEAALARLVLALPGQAGPVLIAWEHKALPAIPPLLAGAAIASPAAWPAERFDLAWVLDREAGRTWRFAQLPQLLLAGDRASPAAAG